MPDVTASDGKFDFITLVRCFHTLLLTIQLCVNQTFIEYVSNDYAHFDVLKYQM